MGMFNFNFFGDREHRVFNYKPRYYDPEKERRKQMFGHLDDEIDGEKKEGKYVPGSHISGSFRGGNYRKTRGGNRAQSIIGFVGLILFCFVLIYIAKMYALL